MSIFGMSDQYKFLALDTNGQTHIFDETPAAIVEAADVVLARLALLTAVIAAGALACSIIY